MFWSLEVVALNLTEVASLEAGHGVVQELQDIDRRLVGQRWQCDTNRVCAVFHGAAPVHQRFGEARRAVVAAGWAKISK